MFVTAKHWTQKSPLETKYMIPAGTIASLAAPSSASGSLAEQSTPSASTSYDESPLKPEQYCRYIVHASNEDADFDPPQDSRPPSNINQDSRLPSDLNQDSQSLSHLDEDPWAPAVWPSENQADHPFTNLMQESLAEGNFTTLPPDSLPISSSLIIESLIKDSRSPELESLKFAITAGNLELVGSILKEANADPVALEQFLEIHPYHLAATYLDGGNTCCSILATLMSHLGGRYPVARNNEDTTGHSISDCLLISVLRSHTNVMPRDVSSGYANMNRYPGEEKDACGRWDADSPIIRQHFQRSDCRIPFGWKHPFYHSSIQAVCHNLLAIFLPGSYNPHIHQPSGLFIRHCEKCGTKLTLGPLHLTVVLAYHLAASGVDGETLFGAVAVLVCLLRLGANVFQESDVSAHEILGDSWEDEAHSEGVCKHGFMDADEFIQTIPSAALYSWEKECRIGWDCMRGILRLAKAGKIHRINKSPIPKSEIIDSMDIGDGENWDGKGPFSNEDGEEDDLTELGGSGCPLEQEHERGRVLDGKQFPCGNPQLGLVWAVVHAEMLTYRRTFDFEPWISEDSPMVALKQWLEGKSNKLEMPLLQKGMLRETTPCRWICNKNFPWSTAQCITR